MHQCNAPACPTRRLSTSRAVDTRGDCHSDFARVLLGALPAVKVVDASATPIGAGQYQLKLVLRNEGFLPVSETDSCGVFFCLFFLSLYPQRNSAAALSNVS